MNELYSVIIPMFNEQEVIAESYKRLTAVMAALPADYELIFVDDGSRDDTYAIMDGIRAGDSHVRILRFARNFGHQIAVTAGLDHARGDAIVIIDADLQDPPEVIPAMIAKWKEGYEVVYGKRLERRGETFFKKATASMFYKFLGAMTDNAIPRDTGDFRLIDKKVLDVMKTMREHNRFLRGMVPWTGFRQTPLEYERDKRWAGETKYPLKKMLKLASDGIISFSFKPLRLSAFFGGFICGASVIYLLVLMVLALCGVQVAVWQWPFAGLAFLDGIILLMIGIAGEYIGRIFDESRGRPLYILNPDCSDI